MLLSPTGLPNTTDRIGEPDLRPPPVAERPAEVLISTQQVLFGSAAVVGARPAKSGSRFAAAMQRLFATSLHESHPSRHYPREYLFIENARMAREMGRL